MSENKLKEIKSNNQEFDKIDIVRRTKIWKTFTIISRNNGYIIRSKNK